MGDSGVGYGWRVVDKTCDGETVIGVWWVGGKVFSYGMERITTGHILYNTMNSKGSILPII